MFGGLILKWLPFYLYGFVNIISFLLFAVDKAKAKRGQFRIPENTLMIFSFFGPFGAFAGMLIFKHKTRKNKFRIFVPLFLTLHVVAIFLLFVNKIISL